MKRIYALTGLTVTLLLSGCSAATSPTVVTPPVVKTNESSEVLVKDTVDTVCALSGKTVLEKEDVDSFVTMAARLQAYEGYNQKEMHATASELATLANYYTALVGVPLSKDISDQFVTGCEQVRASYENAYGDKVGE